MFMSCFSANCNQAGEEGAGIGCALMSTYLLCISVSPAKIAYASAGARESKEVPGQAEKGLLASAEEGLPGWHEQEQLRYPEQGCVGWARQGGFWQHREQPGHVCIT